MEVNIDLKKISSIYTHRIQRTDLGYSVLINIKKIIPFPNQNDLESTKRVFMLDRNNV